MVNKKEKDKIKKIIKLFPEKIRVRIIACEEGGFTAQVLEPEFLAGVITEGENLLELTEMINDAVYLALGVPEKYYPHMPVYTPPKSLYEHFGFLPCTKSVDVLNFSCLV